MDLLILHLSDIHFKESSDNYKEIVEALVKCVKKHSQNIKHILIIISGDIGYSGKRVEYLIAKDFIDKLKDKIYKELNIENIKFAIVPGNHDIDYNNKPLTPDELNKLKKDNSYDSNISNELVKMDAFFSFANTFDCFKGDSKKLLDKLIFSVDNSILQINLINTAIFSSSVEDQGFHYLSNKELEYLSQQSDADYIFTLMHHPHHWFDDRIKKYLEKTLFRNSDVIFVGHEHYKDDYLIENKENKIKIISGGQLYNGKVWSDSSFNLLKINLITRDYEEFTYIWNSQNNIYISKENDIKKDRIERNRCNCLGLKINNEYIKELLKDKQYGLDILKYFVFPQLDYVPDSDKSNDVSIFNYKQFCSRLKENNKLIIKGGSLFGKTSLAKFLLKNLSDKFVVILLDYKSISSNKYERNIKNKFREIYNVDETDYERFLQIDKKEKVLIIDDADKISLNDLKNFFEYTDNCFGNIILIIDNKINFNLKENIHWKSITNSYKTFKISHFMESKRNELIKNVVNLVANKDYDKEYIVQTLCEVLNKLRRIYNLNPDFIVLFTQYYCKDVGNAQNDGELFSKVFEANLTYLLLPYSNKIKIDKIFIILSKVAYKMHIEREYPMATSTISKVIEEYNEKYGSKINPNEFLNMLINSRIIKKEEDNYVFISKTHFSYFIAREIKRKCLEENDEIEFQKLLQYACFGINSDILLFVTYIIDNNTFINKIMDKIDEYTKNWNVFDFENIDIEYLKDSNSSLMITEKVEDKDLDEYKKDKIKVEKKEIESKESFEKAPIYNYDESRIGIFEELVRALSLMIIVSRILPNFEHMMKIEDKQLCVKLIYELPLRIFKVWANQIESIKKDLLNDIKHIPESNYRNQKKILSDIEANRILRWESILLLLDMFDISIGYASKDNTSDYLDSYNYINKIGFKIEHLVSLTKRDNSGAFVKEILDLFPKININIAKVMLQLLARHFIISSRNISREDRQRLNDKLFDGRINQQYLLSKREFNKTYN